jgi:hypothetical protein
MEGWNCQDDDEEDVELDDAPAADGGADGGFGMAAGVALTPGGSTTSGWLRTYPEEPSLLCFLKRKKLGSVAEQKKIFD